jgi:hypothetical protein
MKKRKGMGAQARVTNDKRPRAQGAPRSWNMYRVKRGKAAAL